MTSNVETLPERVLQNERVVFVALLAACGACWAWIVVMARDMYGSMSGASAWMMTGIWDGPHLVLLLAMWAAMMAGMMLPSAAPLVLLYASAVRKQHAQSRAAAQTYALTFGYLSVWILFGVAATVLQRLLATQLIISPMMRVTSRAIGGGVLIVAGIYQLTSLKDTCLRACRSPLAFIMHGWRPGAFGAFRMGVEHGVYCVGCCWALMLLLFVGGVMNLTVIGGLTALIAIEKLAPFGQRAAETSGLMIIAFGVWLLV